MVRSQFGLAERECLFVQCNRVEGSSGPAVGNSQIVAAFEGGWMIGTELRFADSYSGLVQFDCFESPVGAHVCPCKVCLSRKRERMVRTERRAALFEICLVKLDSIGSPSNVAVCLC